MTLLDIRNLRVEIGRTPILKGVDLTLDSGEILGLIGESGSGKSMTALSAMRLLPEGAKTAGSIALDGDDLLQNSEREMCDIRGRDIGMVFQEPMTALDPLKTIGDQVAETALIHGRAGRGVERLAVEDHGAALEGVERHDGPRQGRLARAAFPDEPDILAPLDGEAHAVHRAEGPGRPERVLARQAVVADGVLDREHRRRARLGRRRRGPMGHVARGGE
jgi:ABC-type dipeptide/oligopeptide/nickel transport system ATPase component